MANGAGPARESLQFAVDQPLVRPAQPRRDDRYVAETVNSPAGRNRPQWLHCRPWRFLNSPSQSEPQNVC